MFDVPLNDDHKGYVGPDMHSDMMGNGSQDPYQNQKYYQNTNTRISDIVN